MSLLVKKAQDTIYESIYLALEKAQASQSLPKEDLPPFVVEVPADRKNGDFSANAAMAWARFFKMPPRKLAEILSENLDLSAGYFQSFDIAGPGFMNFYLSDAYYADLILDIVEKGDNYGRSDFGSGKKINVEFVSANPTGPMHMGNARGAALGDCLASVMDWAGYEVSREFYVNDAGNQIEKFALSLDMRYQELFLGQEAPPLPEDSYHGEDIIQRAQEFAAIHGDKFMASSRAERRQALVDYALPKNIEAMRENLNKYRIEYDTWFHESSLYESGELEDTLKLMKARDLTYEKEGALWYKNSQVMTQKLTAAGRSPDEIEKLEL